MISGFQPTLMVPPLSTMNGLISAAMGKYFAITTQRFGYVFYSSGKTVDLETIYQIGHSGVKSNVIKREFLFDNHLWMYTDSQEIKNAFEKPVYPLLLGRSSDLASVKEITCIDREEKTELKHLQGTIVPFAKYPLPGTIQALPVCFSPDIPRQNIGTRPYCILEEKTKETISAKGIADKVITHGEQHEWDIYWQEI
jgi:CRISPR-associated protein Cas5t